MDQNLSNLDLKLLTSRHFFGDKYRGPLGGSGADAIFPMLISADLKSLEILMYCHTNDTIKIPYL